MDQPLPGRHKLMGHHIDPKGRFQSDRYPALPPDKILLSFKDPAARRALRSFVLHTEDEELALDVAHRLGTIEEEGCGADETG